MGNGGERVRVSRGKFRESGPSFLFYIFVCPNILFSSSAYFFNCRRDQF